MERAAMESSVLISCEAESCCQPADTGLRCRINAKKYVSAFWDAEKQAVCCRVTREDHCVPNFSYEVVDASGNTLCRSSDCTSTFDGCVKDARCCADAPKAHGAPAGDPNNSEAAAAAAVGGRPRAAVLAGLSWLDRLLPVWIILSMVVGVLLGSFVPQVRASLSVLHVGDVSLPIALGLWLMMLPVLTRVQYEKLGAFVTNKGVAQQLGVSFSLNWLLGPALMTGLAWACLPDLPAFRNGVILVGLARCIAMVLVWNELAGGDSELCAITVACNSVLQVVLYAPLSLLYLRVISGVSGPAVGMWPVAKSVLLFLGVPLLAGIVLRVVLLKLKSRAWFDNSFMPYFGPCALLGLLYTTLIMFAAQDILGQVGSVARVAVPMLLYFLAMFALSLAVSIKLRASYAASVTQAFTAASNNFELAIAVAVGTFGITSQEALAATVGPLIEVPVLLGLVYVALWIKPKFWREPAAEDELKAVEATAAGQSQKDVTAAGQSQKDVTAAGQSQKDVTAAGQSQKDVTAAAEL